MVACVTCGSLPNGCHIVLGLADDGRRGDAIDDDGADDAGELWPRSESSTASSAPVPPRAATPGPSRLDLRATADDPRAFVVRGPAQFTYPLEALGDAMPPQAANMLGDFDGDGACDGLFEAGSSRLVVRPYTGKSLAASSPVYVPAGGSPSFATTPQSWVFGGRVAALDVDGDGLRDLVVGTPGFDEYGEPAEVLGGWLVAPGGKDGFDTSRSIVHTKGRGFGAAVREIGDFDGDGRADLAVADPDFDHGAGRVYVVLSDSSHRWPALDPSAPSDRIIVLDGDPTRTKRQWEDAYPFDGMHLGTTIAPAGDLDGDGRDDLLLGVALFGQRGVVIEFGRAKASDPATRLEIVAEGNRDPDARRLLPASGAHDLDGDDRADLVLAVDDDRGAAGRLVAVHGGPDLRGWPRSQTVDELVARSGVRAWEGPRGTSAFGSALAPAVDLDNDGRTEVVAFRQLADGQSSVAWILYGARLHELRDLESVTEGASREHGFVVLLPEDGSTPPPASETCDLAGDGLRDLLIGLTPGDYIERRASAFVVVLGWR